jgi:hypothetical protein
MTYVGARSRGDRQTALTLTAASYTAASYTSVSKQQPSYTAAELPYRPKEASVARLARCTVEIAQQLVVVKVMVVVESSTAVLLQCYSGLAGVPAGS